MSWAVWGGRLSFTKGATRPDRVARRLKTEPRTRSRAAGTGREEGGGAPGRRRPEAPAVSAGGCVFQPAPRSGLRSTGGATCAGFAQRTAPCGWAGSDDAAAAAPADESRTRSQRGRFFSRRPRAAFTPGSSPYQPGGRTREVNPCIQGRRQPASRRVGGPATGRRPGRRRLGLRGCVSCTQRPRSGHLRSQIERAARERARQHVP